MIVVTGPGRSGTSVIARLYQAVGMDPGGLWYEDVRAGLEDAEIVNLNESLMGGLGVTLVDGRPLYPRWLKPYLPSRVTSRLRSRAAHPMRWERVRPLAERYRDPIVALSSRRTVVKDPRFMCTLGVWLDAGANVEHVVICLRQLSLLVDSRRAARLTHGLSRDALANSLVYALGACILTLHEHEVPHRILDFPSFLEDPRVVYDAMVLEGRVAFPRFLDMFAQVVKTDLVTRW